ncbi:MAG: sugar kinase [Casimicrobiaceae bacterium]
MTDTPAIADIVAVGEAMIEFNATRAGDPDTYMRGFGGDTSNMVIAAARLGARAGYVSRVGDDAFGRSLLRLWADEGVDTRGVTTDGAAPTGVYFVTHGPTGHEFSYLRGGSAASRMEPSTLPDDVIRGASVLHVSGISQAISGSACDAVFAAIDAATAAGARITYDPNLRLKLWSLPRASAMIRATAAMCNYFLPSLDDIRVLSGTTDPHAAVAWCRSIGAPIVVLKCGGDGVYVSYDRRVERIAGHAVATVDATGAGDCFDGAFAARTVAGDDPISAARYANAAAALATTGFGAVAPLPRDGEVRALLERAK